MSFKNTYHTMGVVNITPNSFSDGGKFLDPQNIQSFLNQYNITYDFGAESTAPFNDPIGIEEERERFKSILNILKKLDPYSFSIDTYRPQLITWLIDHLETDKFIWNDVSGVIDVELLETLDKNKNLKYVYSHNLAPNRESCSDHMNFVNKQLEVESYFINALKELEKFKERLYLDPCFGFSKSLAQNYQLINELPDILEIFDRWVIGISKKSFLQKLCLSNEKSQSLVESEYYHHIFLSKWLCELEKKYINKEIYFRVHDPEVVVRCERQFSLDPNLNLS